MPQASVVVVSFNSPAILGRCLEALSPQAKAAGIEVLVVVRWLDVVPAFAQRFPEVRWVLISAESTIPAMRRSGIEECRGDIVALLEDDCVVGSEWAVALIESHQGSAVAIGGPVEPGDYKTGRDWAVYFCDYGRFMKPFAGKVGALCGNNVSYSRQTLSRLLTEKDLETGFYEVFANWKLQKDGFELLANPKLVVNNINSWSTAFVTNVPFHHGRGFAGMRVARYPLWRRLPYLGIALALPILQGARIFSAVAGRRRLLPQLFQASPWIALFVSCWAAGEAAGYVLGPGRSASRWR